MVVKKTTTRAKPKSEDITIQVWFIDGPHKEVTLTVDSKSPIQSQVYNAITSGAIPECYVTREGYTVLSKIARFKVV